MLKQKFIIDFGAKFGTYLLTALTGIIVARVAGPEVVGTIGYATAYVTTFSFITGLFGSAHIKLVSESQSEADCNKTYSILMAISISLFLITVLGFFFFQRYWLQYKYDLSETEPVILITLLAFIISMLFQINETFYNARVEQAKSNLPSFLKSIIYNLFRIVVVLSGMGAVALVSVNLISSVIMLPFVIYFLKQLNFGKWDGKLFKKYIKISLPIFSIVVTGVIMSYADKLILEYYSSVKEVGYYSAAYSIGGMLILLGNTAGTVFFPLFSSLISQNNYIAIKSKIRIYERFIFVFCLPVITILSIYAHPIITFLLGAKYEPSVPVFSVLVLSSFFIIWAMPYGNILSGLGLFWLSSSINFAKFILFVIMMLILISPSLLNLGAMALAITALITNIFMFLLFYYFAYKKTGIHFLGDQARFISFWFIISPIFYFGYTKYLHSISSVLQLTTVIPITFAIIYVLYYIFGLIKIQDIEILKQTINLDLTFSYIKNEIQDNQHN